jgi:hypothetical protein
VVAPRASTLSPIRNALHAAGLLDSTYSPTSPGFGCEFAYSGMPRLGGFSYFHRSAAPPPKIFNYTLIIRFIADLSIISMP